MRSIAFNGPELSGLLQTSCVVGVPAVIMICSFWNKHIHLVVEFITYY